jgi:hypothetical protein
MNLIKQKKSNKRVVIATSVIDNGINIEDNDLRYIAILSSEKDQFLQMLGRKRIKNKSQKIELYIYSKSLDDLYIRLVKIRGILKAIDYYEDNKFNKDFRANFDRDYYNKEDELGKSIRKIFYTDIYGNFTYNKMALYNLKHDEHFLASMIYMMIPDIEQDDKEEDKDQDNKKQEEFRNINNLFKNKILYKNIYKKDPEAYIKEVLSWLGKNDSFNIENYLEYAEQENNLKELMNFIEEMVDKPINKKEQEKFSLDFKNKCVKVYGIRKGKDNKPIDRDGRSYGISTINNTLEGHDLPYTLYSSNGSWELKKINKLEDIDNEK